MNRTFSLIACAIAFSYYSAHSIHPKTKQIKNKQQVQNISNSNTIEFVNSSDIDPNLRAAMAAVAAVLAVTQVDKS